MVLFKIPDMKKVLFFLVLLTAAGSLAMAQPASSTVEGAKDTAAGKPQKLFINPGLLYISNLTYAGRKNVVSTPVVTPYVNLILKKGFFVSATGYVNTAKNEWAVDGAGITPGYVFRLSKHFDGYISATKYFLADSSSLILASMKGSVDAGVDFTPKLVDVGLTFDYIFGKTEDFLVGASLSRDIKATVFRKASLKITPTASLMAGTQSFYETYYVNTITKKQSAGSPSGSQGPLGGLLGTGQQNPDTSHVITSVITRKQQKQIRKFCPLNAGFSIPVSLHAGKFLFSLTPDMVFPFNEVDLGDGSSSLRLNKPFFFYSAGLSLIL